MAEGNLNTTNLLLGVLAAASVLQVLMLIAVGVMAYKAYSRAMRVVADVERRHVVPLMGRVNAVMSSVDSVLADVRGITARVGAQTERVDSALRTTMDRVDETAGRVKESVASRVNRVLGLIYGLRAAVGTMFNGHSRRAA